MNFPITVTLPLKILQKHSALALNLRQSEVKGQGLSFHCNQGQRWTKCSFCSPDFSNQLKTSTKSKLQYNPNIFKRNLKNTLFLIHKKIIHHFLSKKTKAYINFPITVTLPLKIHTEIKVRGELSAVSVIQASQVYQQLQTSQNCNKIKKISK